MQARRTVEGWLEGALVPCALEEYKGPRAEASCGGRRAVKVAPLVRDEVSADPRRRLATRGTILRSASWRRRRQRARTQSRTASRRRSRASEPQASRAAAAERRGARGRAAANPSCALQCAGVRATIERCVLERRAARGEGLRRTTARGSRSGRGACDSVVRACNQAVWQASDQAERSRASSGGGRARRQGEREKRTRLARRPRPARRTCYLVELAAALLREMVTRTPSLAAAAGLLSPSSSSSLRAPAASCRPRRSVSSTRARARAARAGGLL